MWRSSVLPPVVAFVLACAALGTAGQLGGYSPFELSNYDRFDSVHYLGIAEHGYECGKGAGTFRSRCPDAGWFPGYPALVAGAAATGLSRRAAGLAVALAFCLATLLLAWNVLLRGEPPRRALLGLGFAAFVPGVIYQHAIFPMSLAAFGLLLCVVCLDRGRWTAAGAGGAIAAAAYPTGVLIVPVAALWLLADRGATWRRRVERSLVVGGLPLLAFLGVFVYARVTTGAWNAYFKVQSAQSHGVHLPFSNLADLVEPVDAGPGGIQRIIAVQAWLTIALVIAVCADVWRRRRNATRLEGLLVLLALAFWLVPLTQKTVSYYRGDTLLLPVALLVARLPFAGGAVLTAAAATVGPIMALAFFQGVLT